MTPVQPVTPARLRAAQVLRVHGVRGEVRAEPLGGNALRFTPGLRLHLEHDGGELTVSRARAIEDGLLLLGFEEVGDSQAARELQGQYLCVDAGAARPLGDDEWFVWQLVGLRAATVDGQELGVVTDVEPAEPVPDQGAAVADSRPSASTTPPARPNRALNAVTFNVISRPSTITGRANQYPKRPHWKNGFAARPCTICATTPLTVTARWTTCRSADEAAWC